MKNFLGKIFACVFFLSSGFLYAFGGNEVDTNKVNFYGWGGSMHTNAWIDGTLSDIAREAYGLEVNRVGMDIDDILNLLIAEKTAGKENGSVDLVWINGENFYTAMQADLLYGPITDKVPNFKKYVDEKSPDVLYDFGMEIKGYEVPYGKAQFVFICDSNKVKNPPKNHKELLAWCKKNPGRFTYAALPDFTASAFVRNIIYDIVGYKQFMTMKADEATVRKAIQPALDYLNELKPYLWNQGKTYPADNPALDNLFANGEIYMTMSYNPNQASSEIAKGNFPESSRSFLFDKGTIGNTHFIAIPKNATNKEGALKLINCILTPKAQSTKYDPNVWGDMPVLDFNKMTAEEKAMFDSLPLGKAGIPASELASKRVPEMPANLVPIIEKIWLENVARNK
ncbi:MAG: ABC transporter substrate-binding protein [Treponemataceae bacterium]